MKYGFVPALGTPLDENGRLCKESYAAQINRMLDAGAVGLLCMGSMGQQAFISNDICVEVAETAVKTAARYGAMETSVRSPSPAPRTNASYTFTRACSAERTHSASSAGSSSCKLA